MPKLYLVATPIGNLEDITLRALRVLREVGLIAAEDTRTTRHLLQRYEIDTPVTSYHEHSSPAKLSRLLEALAEKDVALVSDAGTPGISDPGCELVEASREAGFQVVPVPGPSAVTAALAVAGVDADRFLCAGFLPRPEGRTQRAAGVVGLGETDARDVRGPAQAPGRSCGRGRDIRRPACRRLP